MKIPLTGVGVIIPLDLVEDVIELVGVVEDIVDDTPLNNPSPLPVENVENFLFKVRVDPTVTGRQMICGLLDVARARSLTAVRAPVANFERDMMVFVVCFS